MNDKHIMAHIDTYNTVFSLEKELSTDARCNLNEPENAMLSKKKKKKVANDYKLHDSIYIKYPE